ncbi:hypothetical protein [Bacillus sp. SG-1]|uniref:hypothetical protein n=1 Tax=Bacillus sp. SG-1 TaxID=161544 RepID=UPI0001543F78|nr:hypothetical protein [Bacillus sp. SG-1]EDL65906.1 hypothetical protein BSG1_16660 [Bacillus sp. SG-1]
MKFSKLVALCVISLLLFMGCQSSDNAETHIVRGETTSWKANLEVVFTADREMYYVGGSLKSKSDSIPKEVTYFITHSQGGGSGTSRDGNGEYIKIPQGGGNNPPGDIEAFAEEITLRVEWESEDGETFNETIPLD